jgi:hypothetical protein
VHVLQESRRVQKYLNVQTIPDLSASVKELVSSHEPVVVSSRLTTITRDVGMTSSPNWYQGEIKAFQFAERPSPCARVKGVLTTKLTTYWLDVLGRLWTMRRQEARIQGQIRRPWTILDSAPRAPQPQGAGAIPVPPAPRDS